MPLYNKNIILQQQPFTTTQTEANAETVPFQLVMDNLNLQQKNRHKTGNKMHNLVHSIAVQHRVTDINKDAIHPKLTYYQFQMMQSYQAAMTMRLSTLILKP
jgi:hypothetical protein